MTRRLRRHLDPQSGPHTIATVSLKGGVGKTTLSACAGLALARYRPERAVAVDANLHAGTLADRLIPGTPRATVQHLLDDLVDNPAAITAIGDIDRYLHLADRLSVLAGHHDPSVGAAFAGDDYTELLSCLGRFFHLIVADCGTGLADDAMRALLDHTDALVLVTTAGTDATTLAAKTLDWLASHGYPHLVEHSIAVLTHPTPTNSRSPHENPRSRLAALCPMVIDIPADPLLAQGGLFHLDDLCADTHAAVVSLAAAIIDVLPATPHPHTPPGRAHPTTTAPGVLPVRGTR